MTNVTLNFQVKSGLSRLLAMENLTVRHCPKMKTAAFDLKKRELILPVWQNISEDLYDMLIVHEVGHALDTPKDDWEKHIKRIAASRFPDKKVAKMAERSVHHFLNVVEDARIDKRQKRRYPGSKKNYVAGLKELHARDFFGLRGKDINAYSFIDRLNMHFKSHDIFITFSPEEKKFVHEAENTETFEEVIDLTERIFNYCVDNDTVNMQTQTVELIFDEDGDYEIEVDEVIFDDEDYEDAPSNKNDGKNNNEKSSDKKNDAKSENEKSKNEKENENGKSGNNSDDDGKSDDGSSSNSNSGNTSSDQDERKDANDGKSDGEVKNNKAVQGNISKLGAGSSVEEVEKSIRIPECKTEEAAEKSANLIVSHENCDYIYVDTPKIMLENIVDDYPVVLKQMEMSVYRISNYGYDQKKIWNSFMEFKTKENDSISFMVKEFEMRKAADTYARIKISKTGIINTNKLHTYMFNDDIFRRISTVPEGKNHGFIMILDWSGSMTSNFQHTLKQLIALTLFCRRVQIPFEVYSFRDPIRSEFNYGKFGQYGNLSKKDNCFYVDDTNSTYLMFDNFKLRNILSSRMSASTLNKAFSYLWGFGSRWSLDCDPMNGTPLNQAIYAAEEIVNEFRKKNKLQVVSTIVLTDGGSNSAAVHNEPLQTYSSLKERKYFIRDHVTKKMYHVKSPTYGYEITSVLLNILKERTGTHTIGFFLTPTLKGANYMVDSSVLQSDYVRNSWNSNNYACITQAGYDQYYLMNCSENKSVIELNIDSNSSKRKLVTEFSKFAEKKKTNRAMLTEFIKKITEENKAA